MMKFAILNFAICLIQSPVILFSKLEFTPVKKRLFEPFQGLVDSLEIL